jgi:hypothetical protein
MDIIKYKIGCRNCLKSSNIPHLTTIREEDLNIYKKSEFDLMLTIENWRSEAGHLCEFCGSSNLEFYDISVNDYQLYNFENLVAMCKILHNRMLQINIDKKDNDLSLTFAGCDHIEENYLKKSLAEIINFIKDRPDNDFTAHPIGHLFICLTVGYNFSSHQIDIKFERYICHGLSKDDIINTFKPYLEQFGISW